MANDNEIKIVIQVATAKGKAQIKDFTGTADKEFKGLLGSAKKHLGTAGLAAVVAGATGAFVMGMNRAIDKGSEFEQQLADLQAITGIAGQQLQELGDTALQESVRTGVAARDQIEAYKLLASNIDIAAIGGIEGLKRLGRETVTLAQAAGVDLATAANTAASTMNQWKLAGTESARVVNVLAAGSKEGAAEVDDLSLSLKEAGTTAALAGQSLETTVAGLEILGENALKGSQAGTGLRNVLTILQSETQKLADYGITDVNLQSDGLVTTLEKLQPLLSDNAAMAKIFGRENLNAASILIQNAEAVGQMERRITGTNTATEQAAIQTDTYQGAVNRLTNAIDAQLIPAFQESGGVIVQGIQTLTNWVNAVGFAVDKINEWTDEQSAFRQEQQMATQLTQARIKTMVDMVNQQQRVLSSEQASTEEKEKAAEVSAYYQDLLAGERQRLQENISQFGPYIDSLKQQRAQLEETGRFGVENYFEKLEKLDEEIARAEIMQGELNNQMQYYNTVAPTVAENTRIQGQAHADVAVSARNHRLELERLRSAQRPEDELIEEDPLTPMPQTAVDAEMARIQRMIDGWQKLGAEGKEAGKKIQQGMKPGAQATMMLADSLLQAGMHGGNLLDIVANLGKQLASRAILTGLKLLLAPGSSSLGFFGTMFSSFGFAGGGRVRAASGGKIYGPGTTRSDSIPAWLSNREYVVNAASADAMPGLLEAANSSPARAAAFERMLSGRRPDLGTIDRVVATSRGNGFKEGADRIVAKMEEQTRRLEEMERSVNFRVSEFMDAVDEWELKNKGMGK